MYLLQWWSFTYLLQQSSFHFTEEALKRAVINEKVAFEKATAIIEQAKLDADGDVKMDESGDATVQKLPEISYKNPTMLLNEKRKGTEIIT